MYIWMRQGKPWRETYDADAEIITKQHYAGGVYVKYWYAMLSKLSSERWHKNGKTHRDGDKPADVIYYDDGSVEREYWFKGGLCHRDGDKPAIIWYNSDGSRCREHWFKNGVQYTPVK